MRLATFLLRLGFFLLASHVANATKTHAADVAANEVCPNSGLWLMGIKCLFIKKYVKYDATRSHLMVTFTDMIFLANIGIFRTML